MAVMLALSACGQEKPAPATPAAAQGVLSDAWIYTPTDAATDAATGAVTVEPGIGPDGPIRSLRTARGALLDAVLVGEPDPRFRADLPAIVAMLAQRPVARGKLFAVSAGNLCEGVQATHIVWYEPEMIEGRALALALLSGPPDQTGSTVCRVLRYTRERGEAR
jgi:hypothetical protein